MSADPDLAWGGDDDGVDIKLRGKFEADAKLELDAFTSMLREKHGRFYDRNCAEACFRTPGCRFDPHQHWSYCKYDNYPPTCFGLYHVPRHHKKAFDGEEVTEWGWGKGHKFGKLCYQPSQPHCPEQFPVLCRAHRPPHEREEKSEKEKLQKKFLDSFEDDLM